MKNTSHKERKRQQDHRQRIDQRLEALEERITALLSNIDLASMTPNQRVQAACRLYTLMMRLLELRQDYIQSYDSDPDLEAIKNLIQYGVDGREN
jgi:hypothetical protein